MLNLASPNKLNLCAIGFKLIKTTSKFNRFMVILRCKN